MNNKNILRKLIICFSLLIAAYFLPAQGIINPSEGSWANKQILVLDLPYGSQAYYSLSGNDPESSGFAYDGPVLLDVDGDCYLRVCIIDSQGKKDFFEVFYNVKEEALPAEEKARDFISNITTQGLIDYSAGDVFTIPSSLEYCFGQKSECFEQGRPLSLAAGTVIARSIPCTVTDGKAYWRFVLRSYPEMSGLYSRRDVPFEIEDWNKLTFTSNKYIYKIDDQWWELPKLPVTLDRSISHMISWQRLDYSPENPVKFFVLPPLPYIKTETQTDGSKKIYIEGESGYKFGIIDEQGDVSELYDTLKFDTFQGDLFEGKVRVGIFYDSVYQAQIPVEFRVNKKIPEKPVIVSSAQNSQARKVVTLNIQNPKDTELFVSVLGPVIVEEGTDSTDVLFAFMKNDFKKTSKKKILLQPSNDGAAAYKVSAYALDSNNNRSNISEYTVVIDTCNCYVDAEKNAELTLPADGSRERPYGNFEDVIPFLNESRYVRIKVNGEMVMPSKKVIISSNIEIEGQKDARLTFLNEGSLVIRNASCAISNAVISYALRDRSLDETLSSQKLFQVEHGVLVFENVELSSNFGKNGTVIDSDSSVINIKDSGITSSADTYSACLVSVDSKISIKSSKITTVASTAVSFSCQGGMFELRKNTLSIVGVMGRAAELFDTHSILTDNDFRAQLKKPQGSGNPVYMDAKNLSVENARNRNAGF